MSNPSDFSKLPLALARIRQATQAALAEFQINNQSSLTALAKAIRNLF